MRVGVWEGGAEEDLNLISISNHAHLVRNACTTFLLVASLFHGVGNYRIPLVIKENPQN